MSAAPPIPTGVKVAIGAVLTLLFAPFLVFFLVVALGALAGGGMLFAVRSTVADSRESTVKNSVWALSRHVAEAGPPAVCSSEVEARASVGTEDPVPECLLALGVSSYETDTRMWVEVGPDGVAVCRGVADPDRDGEVMEVRVTADTLTVERDD